MDSTFDSKAFKRPDGDEINSVGFGFQMFVRINSLYTLGFVNADTDTVFVRAKLETNDIV